MDTTSMWEYKEGKLKKLGSIRFLFHWIAVFCYDYYFKVNLRIQVNGFSSYGKPIYKQFILDHLIDLQADGSFAGNGLF